MPLQLTRNIRLFLHYLQDRRNILHIYSNNYLPRMKEATITILLALFATTTAQKCFWPNGNPAKDGFRNNLEPIPCPAGGDKDFAACCYPGDYCLSNGLCFEKVGLTMYRAGCTDKSFLSPLCGQYCIGKDTGASRS